MFFMFPLLVLIFQIVWSWHDWNRVDGLGKDADVTIWSKLEKLKIKKN
jgi:hypothetical protein